MENNFDKAVKKIMQDYEVEYKPSDWNLMEEKIEEHSDLQPELQDALIDGVAFDSLFNLEEPYQPEHWNLMREKLDAPYAFRRKLMRYKVLEMSLVALFIFTLVQFLPLQKSQSRDIASSTPTEALNNNSTSNQQSQEIEIINSISSQEDQVSNNSEQTSKVISDSNTTTSIAEISTNETKSLSSSASINNPSSSNPNTLFTLNDQSEENINNTPEIINEVIVSESEIAVVQSSTIQKSEIVEADIPVAEDVNINAALMNPILLKEEQFKIATIEELNGGKIFSDLKQPIKVRIGMAVGADANYIMTPFDNQNFLDAFNQVAPGYSGGFTLGFKYSKWEIETGALYSAVSYASRNVFQIKGSFADGGYVQQGFEGAQIDLIRLPLNLKYNFFTKKKWNVYAYTGSSVNVAVETFYNFTTTDLGSSEASRNFAGRGGPEGIEEEKYDSYDGIFEGGRLSKNTFLTANLGFGVERYFTPRMSIFLQPGYQHQFSKGLGPQSDQINTISILTGAKVTLKKRKRLKK